MQALKQVFPNEQTLLSERYFGTSSARISCLCYFNKQSYDFLVQFGILKFALTSFSKSSLLKINSKLNSKPYYYTYTNNKDNGGLGLGTIGLTVAPWKFDVLKILSIAMP